METEKQVDKYLSALVVAENALDQAIIMCGRAAKVGIDHAGPTRVVMEQALAEVREALDLGGVDDAIRE